MSYMKNNGQTKRRRNILIHFMVVMTVLLILQAYLFLSIAAWLCSFPLQASTIRWILTAVLVVMAFLNLAFPLRNLDRHFVRSRSHFWKRIFVAPGATWAITTLMMFSAFLVKDFLFIIWGRLFGSNGPGSEAVVETAGALCVGAPLVVIGYGLTKTARDYQVQKVEVPIPKLPSGLDGFTIAHISDIHSGIYMPEKEMREIREIMDSLHPHLVAMTGDFVDSLASEIAPVARVFSRSRTEYGIFGCMGNHDRFDNYPVLSSTMNEAGITMLDNTNRTLRINGEDFHILGVEDSPRYNSLARIDHALEGVDPDDFKVLLAHRPSFFDKAVDANVQLQLSGHTHGGQVAVNWRGKPYSMTNLFEKHIKGLYRSNDSFLYVNPGVGMVFAPVRIGVRPEITLITLRQEPMNGT